MAVKSLSFLNRKIYTKHVILSEFAKNKNVVHYGCVDDDEDLIMHKVKDGRYLHEVITNASRKTTGVDMNEKAIKFLSKKLSVNNIVYGNVEDPSTFKMNTKALKDVDVILIPDLIEHLSNPGGMLEGIKKYYSEKVKVVILTPNPFAWYNFVATLLNKEIYTPYHTMYFTSESMNILLKNHGFKLNKVLPVSSPKHRGVVLRVIDTVVGRISMFISPGFADLYLYECSIKKSRK